MSYGYTGKILIVDLTKKEFSVEEHDETFYRTYWGGPAIGAYYALKDIKKGIDPLSQENVLIFATGLMTGSPAPAAPRYTVCGKSPLTGGIGRSEAGGWWGPELKMAGFDAVVIKGKSENPVYLKIENGEYFIEDATDLWGKTTDECDKILKDILGKKTKILQIGPGAENQVLFANIVNELGHFNGRNGLGAVMGSKNLKAITARGNNKVKCFDDTYPKEVMKWATEIMNDHPLAYGLHKQGTPGGITSVNAGGALPTKNWTESTFDKAEQIGADALEEILIKRKGCYICPIRCKRVVEVDKVDFKVDPNLGGPEYETLVCLGSNLGIGNIEVISKANELCNKYTLDTISLGMTISFAMECFENGLITLENTGGLDLSFGNEETLLKLIEMIALKKGFGEKLALGSVKLAKEIGKSSEQYLIQSKGQEVPAHDPRVKTGMGLQYALSSHGADHWTAQHDPLFKEKGSSGLKGIEPLGITDSIDLLSLSGDKVRWFYYTHLMTLMYDTLGLCGFGYVSRSIVSLYSLAKMVNAISGWNSSLWEMMKVGERTSLMLRIFNNREGFERKDDSLPKKFFEPISSGPLKGQNKINEKEFNDSISLYYEMAGLDTNGRPLKGKLYEIGLGWTLEYI